MKQEKGRSLNQTKIRLEGLLDTAVSKIESVLNDPKAKNSEILNSADKLIKLTLEMQSIQTKGVFDKLKLQREQLALEKQQIEMAQLRLASGSGTTQTDGKPQTYSREFTPAMRPHTVDDTVARTG